MKTIAPPVAELLARLHDNAAGVVKLIAKRPTPQTELWDLIFGTPEPSAGPTEVAKKISCTFDRR
jgi:hypothetical protein